MDLDDPMAADPGRQGGDGRGAPESRAPRVDGTPARSRVGWRPLAITAALIGLLLGADWARPPQRQVTTRATLAAIDLYQATLSRGLGRLGARCRFDPSCSRYGEAVIAHHGVAIGGWRSLWRVARCGPWTPYGTVDPPELGPAAPRRLEAPPQ